MNPISEMQNEKSYQAFITNHPEVVLIVDSESGQFLDVNLAAQKFYGYTKEEFLAMTIDRINVYSEAEIKIEMDKAAIENRGYYRFIHCLKDESLIHVKVVCGSVVINHKELQYLTVFKDINQSDHNLKVHLKDLVDDSTDALCLVEHEDFFVAI